jgi:hypothetical protein
MTPMHPLLDGLVDPGTASRMRLTEEHKQALRNVVSVLPYAEVPDKEWFLPAALHAHAQPLGPAAPREIPVGQPH